MALPACSWFKSICGINQGYTKQNAIQCDNAIQDFFKSINARSTRGGPIANLDSIWFYSETPDSMHEKANATKIKGKQGNFAHRFIRVHRISKKAFCRKSLAPNECHVILTMGKLSNLNGHIGNEKSQFSILLPRYSRNSKFWTPMPFHWLVK